MNSDDVFIALQKRHPMPEWVLVRELRLGTGFGAVEPFAIRELRRKPDQRWARGPGVDQRVDAWALNCYPGNGFTKIAYEIKVTHADFIAEKRNPDKRQGAMAISDYFYFVAPRGLIAPMELPKGTGLVVVYDTGRSEILERAPKLPAERLDWRLVASLMRNLARTRRANLPHDRQTY